MTVELSVFDDILKLKRNSLQQKLKFLTILKQPSNNLKINLKTCYVCYQDLHYVYLTVSPCLAEHVFHVQLVEKYKSLCGVFPFV